MKLDKFILRANKEGLNLISIFILVFLIKVILSFRLPSPWIFADEAVYAETARNVLDGHLYSNLGGGYCQTYPPGYSIILSVAYLLSDNMAIIYRIMLIINCIITSSVIFPSYIILDRFCTKKVSFWGSLTIAALPSVTLYTFVLMSENLFIPLFVFSVWFLLESYSKSRKSWDFLAGFSIFYLVLTRSIGLAMIVGFLISVTFYIAASSKKNNISTILKDKCLLVISFATPSVLWIYYKSVLAQSNIGAYNTDLYYATLVGFFSDMSSFRIFISLLLHEMEFLILSSYFIIFFMACIIIIKIYNIFKSCAAQNWNILRCSDITANVPIISVVIYIVTSSIILIIVTVVHMYRSLIFMGDQQYYIFGRYIDPIIPVIFLSGIIGFELIYNRDYKISKSDFTRFILFYSLIIAIFVQTFPYEYYKVPNMFSIFYVQYLKSIAPISIFIVLFSLSSFSIVYVIVSQKTHKNYLFLFLIAISLLASICTLQSIQAHSFKADQASPIGRYLNEHSEGDTLVLMDRLDGWPLMWFSTIFWMNDYPTQYSIEGDLSDMQRLNNAVYIISSKLLPYQPVICSNGYKLYNINNTRKEQIPEMPFVIDIGLYDDCVIENFHGAENQKIRWTKNSSKILIPYRQELGSMKLEIKTGGRRPIDNPANIEWYINNNKIGQDIKLSGDYIYSFVVPDKWLNQDYQILTIVSNTWKPNDYGSSDARDLGVQVDWVEVDSTLEYGKSWHGLEYWGGTPSRWMENDATLIIESEDNRTAELSFRVRSYNRPRTLELYDSGDNLIGEAAISENFVEVKKMPIDLKVGANSLRLHIPEGCERPSEVSGGESRDGRCLSLGFQEIKIS